jgi:hypothetical protein
MNNLSFTNNNFFVGVYTHLKSWKVTIRNSGLELKTFSMNSSPERHPDRVGTNEKFGLKE